MNYKCFFLIRDGEVRIYAKYAPVVPTSLAPGETWTPRPGTVRLRISQ